MKLVEKSLLAIIKRWGNLTFDWYKVLVQNANIDHQ